MKNFQMVDEYMNQDDYEKMKLPTNQPSPQQIKKTYIEANNKKLNPNGLSIIDIDEKNSKIVWYVAIALIVFVAGFLYFSSNEAYKSDIVCAGSNLTAICEGYSFNCSCPPCPSNSVSCPPCPNFPNELNVIIKNN